MSDHWLILRVTLHDPAYHGQPEWPPAPARLFQALVAGNAGRLDDPEVRAALEWLEGQPAPQIGAPPYVTGQAVTTYVPNNDLDTKGGDPTRLGELRVAKVVQARHLEHTEFLYVWSAQDTAQAEVVTELARGLYQFGRGLDMAYATGTVVNEETLAAELDAWQGKVHLPSPGAPGTGLACPRLGSLSSLGRRYLDQRSRFAVQGKGRKATQIFSQPAKAVFKQVPYDARAQRAVFDLRRSDAPGRFAPVAPVDVHPCVVAWRDAAVRRLSETGLDVDLVEGVLVGRRPDQPERVPSALRARIVPIASIGHEHSDQRVRRLMLELPAGGPLSFADIRWAFAGLDVDGTVLVEDSASRMLEHYEKPSRRWTSLTPVALPAARRRIDPAKQSEQAKPASEREREELEAIHAARQALRHAGVRARVRNIEVQREPFSRNGTRAEAFAAPPRFPKERLWHLRLSFGDEVPRMPPLGDGRFVGLGLMRPERVSPPPILAFHIVGGLEAPVDTAALARHLRRAVLARAQQRWGRRDLPWYITGHGRSGEPARGHQHLHYLVDLERRRLLVWQPIPRQLLVRALAGLRELRAGPMGVLELEPVSLDENEPLTATASTWRSVTAYRVDRHRKAGDATRAVVLDLREACRTLPLGEISVAEVRPTPEGLTAHGIELHFTRPITGPLVLGRTRHLGGGMFEPG